jgi:alkylation response protein AidB-like acyl-CoA dehydrogenase
VVWTLRRLVRVVIEDDGDDSQRDEYLVPLAEGREVGAFALSEPGAGSAVPAMETTAEREGDEYVIDGGKLWISNGSVADTVIVFAKTDPEACREGISSFLVRPETDDGFVVEGTEDKLGNRGCPTAELRFAALRIPAERRIGEEGDCFWQRSGRSTAAGSRSQPGASASPWRHSTKRSTTRASASSSTSPSASSSRSSTSSLTWTRRCRLRAW